MLTLEEAINFYNNSAEEHGHTKEVFSNKSIPYACHEHIAEHYMQLAEWLKELKAYKIKFEFIISQLEERASQLEDILEKNSWCDGDEEYRLDEINSVVEFIKKTYESKSVLDMEVNADDSN